MRECDNSKTHKSSNFILSICLLVLMIKKSVKDQVVFTEYMYISNGEGLFVTRLQKLELTFMIINMQSNSVIHQEEEHFVSVFLT